jgi:hypothetical protein
MSGMCMVKLLVMDPGYDIGDVRASGLRAEL